MSNLVYLFSDKGTEDLRKILRYHTARDLVYSPQMVEEKHLSLATHDGDEQLHIHATCHRCRGKRHHGGNDGCFRHSHHHHRCAVISLNHGEARVVVSDGLARNAALHTIDQVLLPPGLSLPGHHGHGRGGSEEQQLDGRRRRGRRTQATGECGCGKGEVDDEGGDVGTDDDGGAGDNKQTTNLRGGGGGSGEADGGVLLVLEDDAKVACQQHEPHPTNGSHGPSLSSFAVPMPPTACRVASRAPRLLARTAIATNRCCLPSRAAVVRPRCLALALVGVVHDARLMVPARVTTRALHAAAPVCARSRRRLTAEPEPDWHGDDLNSENGSGDGGGRLAHGASGVEEASRAEAAARRRLGLDSVETASRVARDGRLDDKAEERDDDDYGDDDEAAEYDRGHAAAAAAQLPEDTWRPVLMPAFDAAVPETESSRRLRAESGTGFPSPATVKARTAATSPSATARSSRLRQDPRLEGGAERIPVVDAEAGGLPERFPPQSTSSPTTFPFPSSISTPVSDGLAQGSVKQRLAPSSVDETHSGKEELETISPVQSNHESGGNININIDATLEQGQDDAVPGSGKATDLANMLAEERRKLRADARLRAQEMIQELYETADAARELGGETDPEHLVREGVEVESGVETEAAAADSDWFVGTAYNPFDGTASGEPTSAVPRWMRTAKTAEERSSGLEAAVAAAEDEGAAGDGVLSLKSVVAALEEEKGRDVVVLDVRGKCDWTDTMVIVTARSTKQLYSLVDRVRRMAKKYVDTDPALNGNLVIEGASSSGWMVLDLGRVVVHSFTAAARAQYDLEGLWGAVERAEAGLSYVAADTDAASDDPAAAEAEAERRLVAAVEAGFAEAARSRTGGGGRIKTKQLEADDFETEAGFMARLNDARGGDGAVRAAAVAARGRRRARRHGAAE
ncbi:hypothetical protein HK405_003766 [Cladochytrium tenue]|nr:hypothetical protein HK405_003766 [Cladochytrium tenue]